MRTSKGKSLLKHKVGALFPPLFRNDHGPDCDYDLKCAFYYFAYFQFDRFPIHTGIPPGPYGIKYEWKERRDCEMVALKLKKMTCM